MQNGTEEIIDLLLSPLMCSSSHSGSFSSFSLNQALSLGLEETYLYLGLHRHPTLVMRRDLWSLCVCVCECVRIVECNVQHRLTPCLVAVIFGNCVSLVRVLIPLHAPTRTAKEVTHLNMRMDISISSRLQTLAVVDAV